MSNAVPTGLGVLLAVRSVRVLRQSQLHVVQQQVERAVLGFLEETQHSTSRVDDDLLDAAYVRLRDCFADLSARVRTNAQAVVAAASRAMETDGASADERRAVLERRWRTLDDLRGSADRALSSPASAHPRAR
ncbi:MAG: hypothetical protein ACM3ZF_07030 [Mycobacterium leprae]